MTARKTGPGAPALAAQYVVEHAWHREEEVPLLRRWRGGWYLWSPATGCYAEITDEQIDARLYQELKLMSRAAVSDVRHALLAVHRVLIDERDLPSWIESGPGLDPLDVAPCANGLLHLPSLTLAPPTPRYFSTTALGAAFDREAVPERWLRFLGELWPDDPASIETLQAWTGYLLTPDTRQQKILLLVGPKRSGKGTIMRVLTALLGRDSVAAPTLASLSTNFGLWPLIGRSAAIVGDARLSGRSDVAQVVERLLSLSGEDALTIDRKHRTPWTGRLSARFTIVSNELPRLADASGALASRMLVLRLERSFLGHEDTHLTDALLAELPGIFAWAIVGWHRLRQRGHFVQPHASAHLLDDLEDLGSPVRAWLRERCEVGADYTVAVNAAYDDHRAWCMTAGYTAIPSRETFGRDMMAAGYQKLRPREGGRRIYAYAGIRLRPRGGQP